MVKGLERFREHFAEFDDRYVLIGGTAATLTMDAAGLPFRATKDLDIVLLIEVLDPAFGERMWQFIGAGGYAIRQSSDGHPRLYRFHEPSDNSYPYMIELFCRAPDGMRLGEHAHLTPLPIDEAVSSLSAILMDDDYYAFVVAGRRRDGGLAWIEADRLIPLKASAWLESSTRAAAGEKVDSRNIRKHLNDVFRLSQLLRAEQNIALPGRVAKQLAEFLVRVEHETVDLKALAIKGVSQREIIGRVRRSYGIDG